MRHKYRTRDHVRLPGRDRSPAPTAGLSGWGGGMGGLGAPGLSPGGTAGGSARPAHITQPWRSEERGDTWGGISAPRLCVYVPWGCASGTHTHANSDYLLSAQACSLSPPDLHEGRGGSCRRGSAATPGPVQLDRLERGSLTCKKTSQSLDSPAPGQRSLTARAARP